MGWEVEYSGWVEIYNIDQLIHSRLPSGSIPNPANVQETST